MEDVDTMFCELVNEKLMSGCHWRENINESISSHESFSPMQKLLPMEFLKMARRDLTATHLLAPTARGQSNPSAEALMMVSLD